jgi:septal ring factor EnvC (AmiA/AmiB activator)
MTNSNDRLDRIEELIQETNQITRSNAKAIEALSAEVAESRASIGSLTRAVATTQASVDGLVQTIAEFSIRSEARLNRLDDAVIGIERILQQVILRDGNGNGDQPQP